MTIIAMVLTILLGTGSLAYGYSQAGLTDPARWFVWIGVLWILAHWRKVYWASSLAFLLIVLGAGYGVWNGLTIVWMLLGALGGLLGWDLSDFARRLNYAAPTDDIRGMELRHLTRVSVVAMLGLGLAWLSVVIRINRLAFEVAVGLVLLAALGLTRLVVRLRRY
ncbi:MAG TPA: hypothetical protein VMJ90_05385 [Anaerolineales bacterium]|nr:hypothetical protein [Anaerolineales bacterium]